MARHDRSDESPIPVRNFLEGKLPEYLSVLERMVAINSYTENAAGVDRLGDYTAELFAGLGFTAERVKSVHPGYGSHLHLRRGTGPSIGLVSHLDTVFPPEEEERNGFRYRVDGSRVYGPGTVDVKGGTLIIYMLMESLITYAPALADAVTWHVLLDASEETESADFGELCASRLGPGTLACLVFEGGDAGGDTFSLVTARKGRASFLIEAHGRGAHAGVDHRAGASAIVQLAAVIPEIVSLTDYARDLTVNIGSINGGGPLNRVPHHAAMEAEARAFDPAVLEEAVSRITALDGRSAVASADGRSRAAVKAAVTQRCPAWPENPATERLFRCYARAAERMGYGVDRERRGGLSDGNYLWDRVPVLDGLGPAGANAHCSERSPDGVKDQEYAVISSFIDKTLLSFLAMSEILHGDGDRAEG